MQTRREFGKAVVGGVAISAVSDLLAQTVGGVHLGVQTYSFRDLLLEPGDHVDGLIRAMRQLGLTECELVGVHAEPKEFWTLAGWSGAVGRGGDPFAAGTAKIPKPSAADDRKREALREWRRTVPLKYFEDLRKRFDVAGINVHAFNPSIAVTATDAEIDRVFEMTKALGVGIITTSARLTLVRRLATFATKHKILVAVHGHSAVNDPEEFSTEATFSRALLLSDYMRVNLDIGHFTAANENPIPYIRTYNGRITNLHLKDRQKKDGPNMVWGEGDTPITAVLQLLKAQRYRIPAYIEYEYPGKSDCVTEVGRCLAYAKRALL